MKIDKEFWGYEISGTVMEVMQALHKCPPTKMCDVSVAFYPDDKFNQMYPVRARTESFRQFFREAKIERYKWGWSIEGTIKEAIKLLQKCPPNKECVASVYFKGSLLSDV